MCINNFTNNSNDQKRFFERKIENLRKGHLAGYRGKTRLQSQYVLLTQLSAISVNLFCIKRIHGLIRLDIALSRDKIDLRKYKFYAAVRDPMERLISAYKDKIGRTSVTKEISRQYYWQLYGMKIIRRYRYKLDETEIQRLRLAHKRVPHIPVSGRT